MEKTTVEKPSKIDLTRKQQQDIYAALEAISSYSIGDMETSMAIAENLDALEPQIKSQNKVLNASKLKASSPVKVRDKEGTEIDAFKIIDFKKGEKFIKEEEDFLSKVFAITLTKLDHTKLAISLESKDSSGNPLTTPMPPQIYRQLKPILK